MANILSFVGKVGKGIVGVLIEDGKLSIGRLLLISMFVLSLAKWLLGADIPNTMLTILLAVLGYVLGSKLIGSASDIIKDVKGATTNVVNHVTEITNIDNGSIKTPDIND